MNQGDHNINKDMIDCDLIDVESLDYSDDQTWLYTSPKDAGVALDIVDWQLSFDWPFTEDDHYLKTETELYLVLDSLIKHDVSTPDKHKFDSRTYVRPKKRAQRPSIQSIVESPPASNQNKYLTYNKYSAPLGPLSPILRLKTFNVETDTDNSNAIKEYASKRRSLVSEEEPELDDVDMTLVSEASVRLSSDHLPSKPINIDLSQPAHNLHNTFNKGLTNIMNERGSLNMYQSGESLMRMSPPSLVSSLMMESSGNFNADSMDGRKSLPSHRDSGVPPSGRESMDPMMTSMTLSILEDKDMSTSFLSQTTYPDNDSLMDSLPPSLVSSVNSSYVVSNMSKPARESTDSNNIFSSATFTHLEQSEKLLSGRPRHQPFNHFQKRESDLRKSESYTKFKEEACQIDPSKVLVENGENTSKTSSKSEMSETVTLHYSNCKFRRDEKENLNSTFEKDDEFYRDMNMPRTDSARNSLNVTLDKQELNEIIQARQKLSLARKALPEPDKLPNQADSIKTIQLPNQIITVPQHSMENASELLSRRRLNANSLDMEEPPTRDTPKRNATFKKVSPRAASMDGTVVYSAKKDDSELIDINLATTNLIESSGRISHEEWGSQERAMVCSSESTDTGTFSSSSPPDSVPDTQRHDPSSQISSTPLIGLRKPKDLLDIHTTISPIYDMVGDKSYTVTKVPSTNTSMDKTYDRSYAMAKAPSANSSMDKTYDMNATVINNATMVKKSSAKRDILAGKVNPDKKMFGPSVPVKASSMGSCASAMAPPVAVARKTGLPTSKLRQYSSHKELSRIPAGNPMVRALPRSSHMVRRGVYASNPALSPTQPAPPCRRDSYTLHPQEEALSVARPLAPAPPALVRQGTETLVRQGTETLVRQGTETLVRQGTETLRRERPHSQLVAPKDLRASGLGAPVAMRSHHMPPPATRPYSIAGATQLRVSRPTSVPIQKPVPVSAAAEPRSSSALPRPSRLPAPRRALRPPSVYSVAPTADVDHY